MAYGADARNRPLIDNFALSLSQLAALGAILIVALGLAALGAAASGAQRFREADLVTGLAIAASIFTLIGAAVPVAFTWIALLVAVAALAAVIFAWRREGLFLDRTLLTVLVIALPFIVLTAAMVPSQWDEFTHWLPNLRYLVEHDIFPRTDAPPSPSVLPAYPYGLSIPAYLASRLTGFMVESGPALTNLLLLLSMAALIVRTIGMGLGARAGDAPARTATRAGLCALALLAVTALNPAFVPKIVFTAYADNATAVALGFAAFLGWRMLESLSGGDTTAARTAAWQCGLTLTALLTIKQVNLVMAASLVGGLALVALCDRAIGLFKLARLSHLLLVPPAIVYVAWRYHVDNQIPGGEFPLLPFSQWLVGLLPDIVSRMALIASKKGGYFGLALIAIGVAIWQLAARRPMTPTGRLAILATVVFLGYNAFLLFAYVAAFGKGEALRAASYWRYNTHLGFVVLIFAVQGLAALWQRSRAARWAVPAWAGWLTVALAVALPVGLSGKLRFDQNAAKAYVGAVAADIRAALPKDATLAIIENSGDGTYGMIMRYRTYPIGSKAYYFLPGTIRAATLMDALDTIHATHLWIHVPDPSIEAATGVRLPDRASSLLARDGKGWKIVRSWPYPGYRRPTDVPD